MDNPEGRWEEAKVRFMFFLRFRVRRSRATRYFRKDLHRISEATRSYDVDFSFRKTKNTIGSLQALGFSFWDHEPDFLIHWLAKWISERSKDGASMVGYVCLLHMFYGD